MDDGWQPLQEFAPQPDPDPALGIFETVLVSAGRARHWRRHRERLDAAGRALYGDAAAVGGDLDAQVATAAAGAGGRARLRVRVRPVDGGPLAADIEIAPLAAGAADAAPVLVPVRVARGFGPYKLDDRRWLERIEAQAGPGPRALLVCGPDRVLETTRANVFALTGGALVTPPLDGSILPGVTRAVLIEVAVSLGIEVREEPLALDALRAADAVLLSGSLRLLEARAAAVGARRVVAALAAALERAGEAEVD